MIRKGELSRETFYCRPGWNEWQKLDELFDLIAEQPKAAPTPAPVKREVYPATVIEGPPLRAAIPRTPEKLTAGKIAGLGCLFLVAIFFGIPAIATIGGCNHAASGDAGGMSRMEMHEAHDMAEDFVKRTYPGADKVSSLDDSIVRQDGGDYIVAVTVDGRNSFGGPIRKIVGVVMEKTGDRWRLKRIEQR